MSFASKLLYSYVICKLYYCIAICFVSKTILQLCYLQVLLLYSYMICKLNYCTDMLFPSKTIIQICYFQVKLLYRYVISKLNYYSELQKHCNVWQFWIACDVALYSIGITLSIVEMK